VTRTVKQNDPFLTSSPLPSSRSLSRIFRMYAPSRSARLAIIGLAVKGEWYYFDARKHVLLASWSSLATIEEWLEAVLASGWHLLRARKDCAHVQSRRLRPCGLPPTSRATRCC
jgi:hypothetical protein